jgi:uncharacterized membrane protein
MAIEHGMAAHLRAGWRMAKVALWIGLFGLAAELVGMLFGDAARWGDKLVAVPLWMTVFFVGGAVYGFLLPASARERPGRAIQVRMRTGALAGAIVALPVGLAGAIRFGETIGLAVVGIMVLIAAVLGAVVAGIAGIAALFRAPPEGGGIGASPRLVDPS